MRKENKYCKLSQDLFNDPMHYLNLGKCCFIFLRLMLVVIKVTDGFIE